MRKLSDNIRTSLTVRIFLITAGILMLACFITYAFLAWATPISYDNINGTGKSTLMKLLAAALLPTSGDIYLDGTDLRKCEKTLKSKLGYLPHRTRLFCFPRISSRTSSRSAIKSSA